MIKSSWVVLALILASTSGASAQEAEMAKQKEVVDKVVDTVAGAVTSIDYDALAAKVEAEAPSITTVARGTFNRARRSISIGPTVGLWGVALPGPGDTDLALSFGLGVELFKVPVLPNAETLKALVMERFKAKLKDQIKARFAGRDPGPVEAETIAKEVFEEVRAEFLGLENTRAKTMERPKFTIGFEANRLFGADRWFGRTRVGIGVWKLTLALSASVGRACRGPATCDNIRPYLGTEVVAHFLTSKNPRASVFDAFLRFDIQTTGRGTGPADVTYDQLVLGVRYLLDVI